MKDSPTLIALVLLAASCAFAQQERGPRQVIVPLAKGGFVAFRNETAPANPSKLAQLSQETPQGLGSRALVDEKNVVHRLLVDRSGEAFFGYDLKIEPDADAKQFNIVVTPLDPQFESTLKTGNGGDSQRRVKTLPKAAEPQVLEDGDAFTLDLLVNQTTGVKIVDIVKVAFDRSNLWEVNPRSLPRDFTLDAVELAIQDCRLFLNDEAIGVGKHSKHYSGTLIWVYLQGRGRFIFSLTPREGYAFRKVGVIEDDKIMFRLKGDQYELISAAQILPGGGTWNLWVLHDKNYTPLVPEIEPAEASKRDPLQKIDDAVQAAKDRAARARTGKRTTLGNNRETQENESKPSRLLIGTANRMEELLPKP